MESLGKASLHPAHLLHVSQAMWNSACISLANISVFVKRSNQSPWIQCQGYLVSAPRVFRDSSLISFLQLPPCVWGSGGRTAVQRSSSGQYWLLLISLYHGRVPMYVALDEDVPLVEFMCLVFTRMPGESYCRRLRSLSLCLCGIF